MIPVSYTHLAFRIRAKQAEAVSEEIKNAKGDYVLVCGDFNDTPISYAHRTIQGDLTDAFAESGREMCIRDSISYKKKNYRIPKTIEKPENLTLEECQKIIAEAGEKPAATKKRTTRKKAWL